MGDFREIPFVKAGRVGNYRVWRSKKNFGSGKDKVSLEQINVSDLDGSWQIKIPATFGMFKIISDLYGEGNDATLEYFFGNMMYVSIVPNGYFHRAVNIIATIYANPSLLDVKDEGHESLMGNVRELIDGFLEWRKEFDKRMEENAPTEQEMRYTEIADEVMEAVSEAESQVSVEEDENRKAEEG